MEILNRFRIAVFNIIQAAYLKMNPIGHLSVSTGMEEQPHPFDLASHIKVYLVNIYAYAAMRAIARDVAATPILIQRNETVEGDRQWTSIEDGDLFQLFTRPNNDETWEDLCERWILGLLGAGNGYLIYDGDDNEFYYARPDWIEVRTDARGRVTGYTVKNKGLQVRQDIDQIIHIKLANPTGDYYGMPPSEVIKKTILMKLNLNTYLNSYFVNNGMLGTVLSTEQTLSKEQTKEIRKELNKLHRGPENAFKIAIGQRGVKYSTLSHPLKDLIPESIEKLIMREVLAAYGVPPIKIGILDEATYNNAKEQISNYERTTCEPIRRKVRGTLNLQLVPRFGENLRVWHDTTEIPGLQEDLNEKSKRVVEQWKGGLIMLNEAREDIGKEPIEEGGDGFYVQQVIGINPFDNPEDGDGDDGGQKYAMPSRRLATADDPRVTLWKAYDKRLTKKEKSFAKRVSLYFDAQLDRLLEKIEAVTAKGLMMSRIGLYLTKDGPEDESIPKELIKDLFDVEEENTLLRTEIGPVISRTVEEAGQEAFETLSADFAFNVHNPEVQNAIETFTNRITKINDSTYKDIKRLLSDAYESGESIAVVERRLREQYSHFSKVKAKTIARTEMNGMVNGGTQLAYEQGGVEQKEWLSTRDANVRDTHIYADGQVRNIKEPFQVGDDNLMHPGDPGGSAAEVANCRCAMMSVIKDDSQ